MDLEPSNRLTLFWIAYLVVELSALAYIVWW